MGCADYAPDPNSWVERFDDKLILHCNSTSESWHLTCRDNQWMSQYNNTVLCGSEGEQLVGVGGFPARFDNFPSRFDNFDPRVIWLVCLHSWVDHQIIIWWSAHEGNTPRYNLYIWVLPTWFVHWVIAPFDLIIRIIFCVIWLADLIWLLDYCLSRFHC